MPTIVIDPGHGGRDPGAVANGFQEKDIVLSTSLKLRDALKRCGFTVIMTRETDVLPYPSGTIGQDLSHRASIANQNNADLFISWHADSYSSATVNGVSVWIHPSTRGARTDQWAQRMVNAMAQETGQSNRGVYIGDFAVLRETNMDAVLVESGFITNPQEAQRLSTPTLQTQQAESTAKALCGIFNLPYVAPAAPTPARPQQPPPQPPQTEQPPQGKNPQPATPTPDTEEIPEWAQESIERIRQLGVMNGYPDGTWRPEQTVTRAELAVALMNLYDVLRKEGV